ncbi:MAG: family 10 glycosylhydrolase [Clostridia bacterium]|nr:family 10 glycosylhydrolase [Clostridia bacterium]
MQIKRKNIFFAGLLSLATALCVTLGVAALPTATGYAADESDTGTFSQTGLTVTVDGASLTGVYTDPVSFVDIAASGVLVNASETVDTAKLQSADAIVFTAEYPTTTTGRTGEYTEYTVEYLNKKYVVTQVNSAGDGATYIPVGGYVLSLSNASAFEVAVGDEVSVTGENGFKVVDKAVESSSGARIAVDSLNGNRTGRMTVYYDYDFGAKTGQNEWGSEMAAVFDAESGAFKVTGFLPVGAGDGSGMEIPDNGFVLSSYGKGTRGRLVENLRFGIGDELSLKGFEYIRFGGEPVTYTYDYVYRNADDPNDEFNQNDGRFGVGEPDGVYAAYRGEDQTIVYRYGWSYKESSGTGTNVHGYEAAVDSNGNVVERGVNVSSIPVGGYVISGHGVGRDFIRSSIPLGAAVSIDESKKQISITTSLHSFFINVQTTVKGITAQAQAKIDQLYDVDGTALSEKITRVNELLASLESVKETIETQLEKNEWTELEKTRSMMSYNAQKLEVEDLAYEILAMSAESKPVAARAVWHRPTEKTLAALTETLDTYQEIGMNLIFVEAFYNGYSLFKSEYVDYHKDFESASYGDYPDYLSAFVALAKERGIEVHAWVEDFYVGLDENIRILSEHSDWLMYNADGTKTQKNEGGEYLFIDPVNPEVQDFLITYYKELLTKNPDIAGLNLDYIRYPVSSKTEDTGFTEYAMKAFAKSLGRENELTKTDLQELIKQFRSKFIISSNATYNKWCEFRMQAVTDFVERVYKEIKLEKDIILSTAVFSSITQNKEQKKQDWQTWFKNGWIDIATPMAYFTSDTEVLSGVSQMIVAAGSKCYYYTGIASSYSGLPAYENCYQIEASYKGGANGYVIFCSTQVIGHQDVQDVLKAGVNKNAAVLPHDDTAKVLKAYFDTVLDRANRIYLPAGGTTAEKIAALQARFEEILAMPDGTADELDAIYDEVNKLTKESGVRKFVTGYSGTRVNETMKELCSLLDTKIQILEEPKAETPPAGDEPSGGTPALPTTPDNGNESSSGCGGVIGGVSVALCALGAAVIVCMRKKKE